jgi:hypothetical protein
MFRFTIRDVLWLTLVIALCVAWFSDHASEQARRVESATIYDRDMRMLRTEINALKENISILEFRSKHGVDPPP